MAEVGIVARLAFSSASARLAWLAASCGGERDTSDVKLALDAIAAAGLPCFAMTGEESEWRLDAIGPLAMWKELAHLLRAVMQAAVGRGQGRLQVSDFLCAPIEEGAFEGLVIDVDGDQVHERLPDRDDQKRGIVQSFDLARSVMTGAYEDEVFENRERFCVEALLSILPTKLHRDAASLRQNMRRYGKEWLAFAEARGFTVGTGDPLPPRFVHLADRMEDIYVLIRSSEWSFELLSPTEAKERMQFIEECAKSDPDHYQRFVGMLPLFGMDYDCLVLDEMDSIHLVTKSVDRIQKRFAVGFGELLEKFIVESCDE